MSYVDGCVGTWPKEKRSESAPHSFIVPYIFFLVELTRDVLPRSGPRHGESPLRSLWTETQLSSAV